ncbi:hypothetical protein [Agrobacterium tumefaciens]|uniref:hypothetical protein n=1 Tax=Agrobacterium tumefaciens TaxID=358 RepID=UPI00287D8673|nr:hypothetical protein [Agrobacterium tumefaciens]MDS7598151.1 hypothetical protein [Agrobacterium tumefaciens]
MPFAAIRQVSVLQARLCAGVAVRKRVFSRGQKALPLVKSMRRSFLKIGPGFSADAPVGHQQQNGRTLPVRPFNGKDLDLGC